MTAYSQRLRLEQSPVFSYTTNTAYSYEATFHEDNHEGSQHTTPEYDAHSASTSPAPVFYDETDTGSRMRDDREEGYGTHYHYGKLWATHDLGRYGSPWTTTSSSNWMTIAQDAALSPLLSPATGVQMPQIASPNQGPAVHEFEGQISNYGGVYPASPPAMVSQSPFPNSPNVTVLPQPEEIYAPSFSLPLFGVPRSPRFIRSLKIDPSLEAHQMVPPEKLSSYSELSPNIEFMERLKLEESYNPIRTIRSSLPAMVPAAPQPPVSTTPAQRPLPDGTPVVSTGAEKSEPATSRSGSGGKSQASSSTSTSQTQTSTAAPPKKRKRRRTAVDESRAPGLSGSEADSRKTSLSSVCTFCRERKISCGPPPPGSTDDTCNQCARRSFKCVFLPEGSSSKSRRRS